MNKEKSILLLKEKIYTLNNIFNLEAVSVKLAECISVNSDYSYDIEYFKGLRSGKVEEIIDIVHSNIDVIEYLKNNLDIYCNFYILFSSNTLGLSDAFVVWFKFQLTKESKDKISDYLNNLKIKALKNPDELFDFFEAMSSGFFYKSNLIEKIEIVNLEIL